MTNWQQIAEELREAAAHVEKALNALPDKPVWWHVVWTNMVNRLKESIREIEAAEKAETFVTNKEPTE